MDYCCGLDFGTSNSVVSLLPLDGNEKSATIVAREPSVVFIPKQGICESLFFVGDEAIDTYLRYHMQGRFIQALKSLLGDDQYYGTMINRRPYHPTDLIALILGHLRKKAEDYAGKRVTSVVVGRPAYFSAEAALDRKAELSLKNAARMAGFREIAFQYEPIAAAYAYESRLRNPETVLVADIGGGTSDFTVMRLDPNADPGSRRREDVLATHGVPVGGNGFDSSVMWHKLVKHFGYGSFYESWGKQLDMPVHIYQTLCRWEQIAFLKTSQYREDLRYFLSGASDRKVIQNLITLIDKNLGFSLFKSIEDAKIFLTEWDAATIDFDEANVTLHERITEPEFNSIIIADLRKISRCTDDILKTAKLREEDINAVFLTGGSSLVRRIQKLFVRRFGEEKVRSGTDTFTSVAIGLALSHKHGFR